MMNKFLSLSVAILAVSLLAGCSGNHDGPYGDHTANWYVKHRHALKTENRWCNKQSAKVQFTSKSCNAVSEAQTTIFYKNAAKTPDYVGSPQ